MNPALAILLVLIIPVAGFIALAAVRRLGEQRVRQRALEDYRQCRGTQHAEQLRRVRDEHKRALRDLEGRQSATENQVGTLGGQRSRELSSALSAELVRTRLTDVPGIGPTLRDRIVESCFSGSLGSLTYAGAVRGVGPEKAEAIRHWVAEMQRRLPEMLSRDFPEKTAIVQRFVARERELKSELSRLAPQITAKRKSIAAIDDILVQLGEVSEEDFLHALSGDRAAAQKVGKYSVGLFPPWERPPSWFVQLLHVPEEG